MRGYPRDISTNKECPALGRLDILLIQGKRAEYFLKSL